MKNARAFSLCTSYQAEERGALAPKYIKRVALEDLEKTDSDLERERKMKGLITVEGPNDVSLVSVSAFPFGL